MQTHFTAAQLADPGTAAAARAIRSCVHCGFCNATCPTYQLLGDELDGPRGRVMLMKDMLENQRVPSAKIVGHIDKCLSCLSCITTCPSGVDYMHLVDHSRAYIEQRFRRPWADRLLRAALARLLPYRRRFAAALMLGRLFAPLGFLIPDRGRLKSLRAMLDLARAASKQGRVLPAAASGGTLLPGAGKGRVAFLRGCAEPVLQPGIQQAAARLLARVGYEVVEAPGQGCCGALVHHLGREAQSADFARANVDAWSRLIDDGGLAAIVITASGCGTSVKDYGHLLRHDPAYAARAAQVAALARDVSEVIAQAGLPEVTHRPGLRVAYHAACSLQHGQRVREAPRSLLAKAGFSVLDIPQGHLCCGSAGVYNILQADIAGTLRDRKLEAIASVQPDLIASGNIGCLTQLAWKSPVPVVHTVELLDWTTGGPAPAAWTARGGQRLK